MAVGVIPAAEAVVETHGHVHVCNFHHWLHIGSKTYVHICHENAMLYYSYIKIKIYKTEIGKEMM